MQVKKETNSFASYRIFQLLKFLNLNSADVRGLIKYMESIDPENKSYSVATVYKYLATLKIMGIEVLKVDNKFHIEKLPFTFDFSKEEVRAIRLINHFIQFTVEKKLKNNIEKIVDQLIPKLSNQMKEYYDSVVMRDIAIPRSYSEEESLLVNRFEKFMEDDLKLCVKFVNDKNEIVKLSVEPIEIEYKDKNVFFTVFESKKGNVISIELEKIIELNQLPQKSHKNFIPTTTTFLLKDRLIKNYVLKKGEKTVGFDINGNLIVLSQNEDKNKLVKRLLGYGPLCEIISPKVQRDEIIEELDEMLKNYK